MTTGTPAAGAAEPKTPATQVVNTQPPSESPFGPGVSDEFGDPKAERDAELKEAEKSEQKATDPTGTDPEAKKAENQEGGDEQKHDRNKVPAKVRIAQLNGKYRTAQAQAEANLERAQRAEQRLQELEGQSSDANLTADQQERARLRGAMAEQAAEEARAEAQRLNHEAAVSRAQAFEEQVRTAAHLPADTFDKFSALNVNEEMAAGLFESERAPELARYFADNPETAENIYRMTLTREDFMSDQKRGRALYEAGYRVASPAQQREGARMLARIEAGLAAPKPKVITKAPDPGTMLNGGTPPPQPKPIEEEEDYEVFRSRRLAELKDKRR